MTELEKLNAIRERNGMLPLTELPLSPEQEAEAKRKADEEKKSQELEAKKKEEEAAEEERKKKDAEEKKNAVPEIDDEKVLAYLQKNKGLKVSSFDDLKPKPTEEQLKEEQEAREAEKLSWAFKNKKIKKDEFESFISDSKDPKKLIFNSYAAKVKAANPEMTDEQVQEAFTERFGLNQDPESWQYKQGQEELSLMADNILNKKYGHILSIDQEYSAYEQSETQKSSEQAKIIANAPAYRKDIEEIFSAAGKYKTKVDGEDFEIELPADFIEQSKNYFLQDSTAASNIKSGWTKEDIAEQVKNMILIEHHDFISQKKADKIILNRQKGSRGIVPPRNRRDEKEIKLDEKLQKAAERHGATVPATAN